MPDNEKKPEPTNVHVMKAAAIQQAMMEVLKEQRTEIVRRARLKLKTLGINISEQDVG